MPEFAGPLGPGRPLGKTGFIASRLGIGDLADRSVGLDQCVATVRRAMDAGLNVIDTAPGYEDGYSQQIVAQALKGRREEMFVIDKIDHHDQPVAPQVQQSLRRLEVDHVDLMVFHGASSLDGWRRLTSPGGGLQQLLRCRQDGQTRFVGISSHDPDVLLEAMDSGLMDVVLFPVGPYVDRRFVDQVLPAAKRLGVATVCFKTFGAGKLLGDTEGYSRPLSRRPRGKISSGGADDGQPQLPHLSVRQCVHHTLTLGPDVAMLGLSFPNEQDAAFAAAMDFTPLSAAQMDRIDRLAAEAIKGKGRCWWNPQ